jgi:hypothetical protein
VGGRVDDFVPREAGSMPNRLRDMTLADAGLADEGPNLGGELLRDLGLSHAPRFARGYAALTPAEIYPSEAPCSSVLPTTS